LCVTKFLKWPLPYRFSHKYFVCSSYLSHVWCMFCLYKLHDLVLIVFSKECSLHPSLNYSHELCVYYLNVYYSWLFLFRPHLWSSGQSSWLQIQRSRFDSQSYQIFLEIVGLERGPLGFMSIIKELLERKSSNSGLEN
jgi:hypothetical protein